MRFSLVVLPVLLASSAALAAPEKLGTFVGIRQHQQNAVIRGKPRAIKENRPATVSFTKTAEGHLHIFQARPANPKPWESAWDQTFHITSDSEANGVRTIVYERPDFGTAMAKRNLRKLNDQPWYLKPFGGYKAVAGGGTLELRTGLDGGVTWKNAGAGRIRILWSKADTTWQETFDGN